MHMQWRNSQLHRQRIVHPGFDIATESDWIESAG
jgi:hypothetical protein